MISKASYLKWKEWNIRNWYHTIAILEIISPHWYSAVLLDLVMAEMKWKSEYLSFQIAPKGQDIGWQRRPYFLSYSIKTRKFYKLFRPIVISLVCSTARPGLKLWRKLNGNPRCNSHNLVAPERKSDTTHFRPYSQNFIPKVWKNFIEIKTVQKSY